MRPASAVLMAVVGVVGLAVAGCTDSSAGVPLPPSGTSTGTSAPDSSGTTSGPPRPRELRLDGKDPCALIPPADRAKFYIERPGRPRQNDTYKSPECLYSTDVASFRVALVVTEGIEKWTDGSKSAEAKEAVPVAGFPAISATIAAVRFGCDVAVDVAAGQYLLASVLIDTGKDSQLPEKCEYAHQLAESAMKTLGGA